MVKTAKARPIRRSVRASRSAASARARPSRHSSSGPDVFADDWQAFVDHVRSAIQRSINVNKPVAPYDQPASVLKRMVYRFVLFHNQRETKSSHIQKSIDNYRQKIEDRKKSKDRKNLRHIRISYSDNPFYWVILGLQGGIEIGNFKIRKHDISRFSQQLLYADRHDIPLEFLIGFLLQSGSLSETVRKAKDPDKREAWYVAMNGDSQREGR